MHARCISMSTAQLAVYSAHVHYQFFCLLCVNNSAGRLNYSACLSRIAACAPDMRRMCEQAASEQQLLSFYSSTLPALSPPTVEHVSVDETSVQLLSKHSPWLLTAYVPVSVVGDGNCLFRAVSYAMYGRECMHTQLRLLAAIEVLLNPALYDVDSDSFYAPYRCDSRLVLPGYCAFVAETVRDGSYSDMLTVLSLSTVIQQPIQTRWPVIVHPGQASPMTKLVSGRNVSTLLPINILWSVAGSTSNIGPVVLLNHFVPLLAAPVVDEMAAGVHATTVGDDEPQVSVTSDGEMPERPVAEGHPLDGEFLSLTKCVSVLTGTDEVAAADIPTGVKENVWFVGLRCNVAGDGRNKFWDDCGAWTDHHGSKTYHLQDTLVVIYVMQDGAYGTRHRVQGSSNRVLVKMEPQPTNVLCVQRMYAKLARDVNYRRRITYIDGCDKFIAEYLGVFPAGVQPHGNAEHCATEYVRTRPAVLQDIAATIRATKDKPRKIYMAKQLGDEDESTRPRNVKQVANVASRLCYGDRPKSSSNLADEIQTLLSRLSATDEDFVLRRTPCVVLFTQQQINDLRSFCCGDAPDDLRSVFAVDRTFNLSSLYVTVTVFRHRKLVRKTTQEAPIFIGPMMLHGDGKFPTYLNFFSTLRGALDGDFFDAAEFRIDDKLVTGSDEETALVKALQSVFPQSRHMFCTVHCKDNVRHHLTAIGTPTSVREHVLGLLFGCAGVAEAADEHQLDDRTAQLMQYVRQQNIDAVDYLQDRTLPKLAGNCRLKWQEPWLGQHQWTNNNCESANHVLKMQVDWKPARITDLVDHLRDVVRMQYNELRRALCGLGEFQLAPAFSHHVISQMRWTAMSDDARTRAVAKLTGDSGRQGVRQRTVTSSDANLTVTGSPRIARKKGQRRRPNAERCTSNK